MDSNSDERSRALTKNEQVAFEKLKIKWKELPVEDVILDGLYLNCIRLVKEYFEKNLKIDLKQNKINDIGLKSVLQLLADKDLRGAEILLSHMNFDSNQKIYQICFFTPYKQLRDYLLSVLVDRKKLNDKETDMIGYLKNLEAAYPCRSFSQASQSSVPFKYLNYKLVESNVEANKNDYFICKELVRANDKRESVVVANLNTKKYGHVIIEWLRDWPAGIRKRIILDSVLGSKDKSDYALVKSQADDRELFSLTMEQNNLDLLIEWINFSFSSSPKASEAAASPEADEAVTLFSGQMTQSMVDELSSNKHLLANYSNEILLNILAKLNVFCAKESADFHLLLRRLCSSLTLFERSLFTKRDDEFHLKLATSLITKRKYPFDFLWSYLDFYNASNPNKNSQGLLNDAQQPELYSSKCLKMMQAFRQIFSNVDSANYFSNVCMKNVEFYFNQIENMQMSNLFDVKYKEHHLVALAMSLYCDIPLTVNESIKFEHLIDEYPSLRLLVDSKQSKQPISLYALLQEHTRLDLTKIFNWQSANTIALFKQDDKMNKSMQSGKAGLGSSSSSSLLSFENAEFAKRFAYKDTLDFAFFLRQGRPFFAYHHFLSNQLKKYGKINKTLMEHARLRSQLILIENFQDTKIVSSCITFNELMNADSFRLKLNVYLMSILNDYYIKRGMEAQLASKKCKYLFTEFFKGDVEAKRLVDIFEHVLITVMIENYDQKQMFTMEACSIWLPLMCFCKIHNLPYSCKYLHLCAESNQWLMYLIFAQMYQIPRYQVISGLEYFSDTGVKQHLEYALHNVITSQYQSSDSTASSLSLSASANKMNKNVKKENRITSFISAFKKRSAKKPSTARNAKSSSKDKKNDSSENEQSSEYETELESSMKAQTEQLRDCLDSIDFYELLINCQNAADPVLQLQLESLRWHTPVLAVFATFYQNHDKISCLTTFLNASMKQQFTYSLHQQHQRNLRKSVSVDKQSSKSPTVGQAAANKSVLFGLNDLKEAIQIAASKSYLRTLLNSLKIFIPKTILDIYVEFLYNIFVNKDASQAQKLYSSYKYELIKVTLNKHQSYIPLEWYEEIMNKLTRITILKCHNIEDLNNLTSILGEINEYRRLIKLVYTMKSNKVTVNCEECLDMDDKSDQFTEICFKVIEELLKVHKFNEAEDLADFCELTKDRIHLARIGYQIEKLRLNNDFEEILVFWKSAHIQLMKIGIKDSDFIDFLKFQNTRSNMFLERIVLLNLISQLCPNDLEISKSLRLILLEFVNNYKKKNELSHLKEIFKKVLLPSALSTDPLKDLLEVIKDGRPIDFSEKARHNLNDQDKDALNILLNNLVDIGKLSQAYTVAKDFGYFNKDLKIILNMLYVCLDMIKPDELDYCMQSFDSASFKGIKLTNVLRSLSRTTESETIKDRIECLEKLACLSHYGSKYCNRIKLDFRLAHEILKTNYVKILNENEWSLLKTILYSAGSTNKYEIAKEFSKAYELNQLKLTDFLLEEVMNTLNAYANSNKMSQASKQLIFNPMSSDEFSRLIKIFDTNSNLFGAKLLDKSRQLLADAKNTDDYTILTELLIRSHDCFIQSCSMEGISNVLQASKLCASKLEKAGEFNIMIRLLTGIAHFSEMTYIMDFLWNNHQFEMLFGKGIGKDDKLRLALLDYLKRYHPNDHETYTMVTLNFTMHREIASMLEEAAYQQLKLLENKTIESTPEILTDLQSILQYFSDAAQSFMKEDCVKQAENCIKKARLIALQIHFLSANLIIINLNSATVSKFIVNHPKFWEAFIVSEAYEKKTDWPQALFNQFILNGNEKYLLDFKSHCQLTSSIFDEVASRFKLSDEASKLNPAAIENMKKFLKYCKDVGQYYKLASILDLKDVLVELQSKNYSSIVNDLIANKKLVIQL